MQYGGTNHKVSKCHQNLRFSLLSRAGSWGTLVSGQSEVVDHFQWDFLAVFVVDYCRTVATCPVCKNSSPPFELTRIKLEPNPLHRQLCPINGLHKIKLQGLKNISTRSKVFL